MSTLHLRLKGISCAACAVTIENAIANPSEVGNCQVNLALDQAKIVFDPQQPSNIIVISGNLREL